MLLLISQKLIYELHLEEEFERQVDGLVAKLSEQLSAVHKV